MQGDVLSTKRQIMNSSPSSSPRCFTHGLRIDRSWTDPAEISQFAPYWRIEQTQLAAGKYVGHIRGLHTRAMQLGWCEHSRGTRINGFVPAGSVVLAFCLPSPFPTSFCGRRLESREMMIVHDGEEFVILHSGATRVLSVAIDQALANEIAHSQGYDSFHRFLSSACVASVTTARFVKTGRCLWDLLAVAFLSDPTFIDEAAAHDFECRLLEALFSEIHDQAHPQTGSDRRRQARKAENYLQQHMREPLDLMALCRELGAPSRTVQYGFRETYGLSMKSYAQALRFNGAHRDLSNADPVEDSVKAVALSWGFRHLGRFATDYHKWFGQCPRATLSSARTCHRS